MISIVCFCSFLFGNWSLKWDEKNGRFKFNYYFILTSSFMIGNFFYMFYATVKNTIEEESIGTSPQYLIIYAIYFNLGVLILNRWTNSGQSGYFANELYSTCGRTVESGRHLPEFWFRTAMAAMTACLSHYKYSKFSDMSPVVIAVRVTVPTGCCAFAGSTMECQYAAACNAIADEFAAVNRMTAAVGAWTAADDQLAPIAAAHCRLARIARLFNDEYGLPMFLTTVNLLLNQIYAMNDVVSIVVDGETFESSYTGFAYFHDTLEWTGCWLRLWWICYRADGLIRQALDFLDQLLHRHVRITAWGFYDVNKELIFMVLGYQFGLCLICTQFTTSGIQLINNLTTIQTNHTSEAFEH